MAKSRRSGNRAFRTKTAQLSSRGVAIVSLGAEAAMAAAADESSTAMAKGSVAVDVDEEARSRRKWRSIENNY